MTCCRSTELERQWGGDGWHVWEQSPGPSWVPGPNWLLVGGERSAGATSESLLGPPPMPALTGLVGLFSHSALPCRSWLILPFSILPLSLSSSTLLIPKPSQVQGPEVSFPHL